MRATIKSIDNILRLALFLVLLVICGIIISKQTSVSAASAVDPNNLILNPSVETDTLFWNKNNWGSSTPTFLYGSTGHTDSHSLSVSLANWKRGDAKWYPNPVNVTPSTSYNFSDWYKGTVPSEIDAVVTSNTGVTSYIWLGTAPASTDWKQTKFTFKTPANASKVTIYHLIKKNGQLSTDDYDLRLTSAPTPPPPAPTPPPPAPTPPPPAPTPPPPAPTPPPSGANTIPNPSVETADSSASLPNDWRADKWGTNTAAFEYLSTGHTGNRSLKTTVSNYKSGSANWSYTTQNVQSGHFRYSDWYKSDVTTEIDAAVTVNGIVQYYYLGSVQPSSTWAQAKAEFDIPVGATSITIFHLLAANGTLTTDDFSFELFTPTPFNRGIVSLTFDDGWTNQHTNALPLLNKYGQKATFYIMSGELNSQPEYMSISQINDLIASGNEIASHSITHPDLTVLSVANYQNEMLQSKNTLQTTFGVPVNAFAYPFGAYNANTLTYGKSIYTSQRTVESGFNTKDNLNYSKLVVQNIFDTTTPAQVKAWVDQANQSRSWLILVYHEIALVPIDPTDGPYTTKPSDLDAELGYIKSTGISVQTIQQAMAEIAAQP